MLRRTLRSLLVVLVCVGASCNGGREPGRRDARIDPARTAAPTKGPATATDEWSGSFEGREEPAEDVRAADAGTEAWTGRGTIRFEVDGEDVTGNFVGEGMECALRGTLVGGKLRTWLRSEGEIGSLRMGRIEGALEGEAIRGSWRLSTSAGAQVRAGSFEARKGAASN